MSRHIRNRRLKQIRKQSFENRTGGYSSFPYRGFVPGRIYPVRGTEYFIEHDINRFWVWPSYDVAGPHDTSVIFSAVLKQLIDSRGSISLLDIGSGSSKMLCQVVEAYGEAITNATGVTAFDYSPLFFTDCQQNVTFSQQALALGVEIVLGDAQKLAKTLRSASTDKFDLITSVGCMHYLADPLNVIVKAYEALLPGGYLFVDLNGMPLLRILSEIKELLKNEGYELWVFDSGIAYYGDGFRTPTGGVVVKKTHQKLRVPINRTDRMLFRNGGYTVEYMISD